MLRYRGNKEELQNYMREHAAYFSDLTEKQTGSTKETKHD